MQYSDYKRLKVWQKVMDLTAEIYRLVSAEGHGRQSDKKMVKFLLIARGSLYEAETQLQICVRMCFLHKDSIKYAIGLIDEIGKMICSLINYRQSLKSKV